MNKIKTIIIAFITIIYGTFLSAEEILRADNAMTGFRHSARIAYVNSGGNVRKLTKNTDKLEQNLKTTVDNLFNENHAKIILIVKGNEIIYEKSTVNLNNTPLAYSMSKSLTSLAVGKLFCDGHIKSLNDKIEKYVPELSGTSWGNSAIRDVLIMASGAYSTPPRFNGHKNQYITDVITNYIYTGQMSKSFLSYMKEVDEREYTPGSRFNYNNFDTVALGILVEKASKQKFPNYFQQKIWSQIGAEANGGWIQNSVGETSTFQGFSAKPYDYIRLGLYVLDELNKPDTCFGKYLGEATTSKINASGPSSSYGYQIWTSCGTKADFCFIGYGGQKLVFNKEKRIVLYQHATYEDWNTQRAARVVGAVYEKIK